MVSAQLAPHWVKAPQPDEEHAPCAQTCPVGHALPQVPQLAPSIFVSTHPVVHGVKPAAHAHMPA
jgi:hypothetical protein